MTTVSTTDLYLRSDRVSFGIGPPEVARIQEQLVIAPDSTRTKLFIGPSTLISSVGLTNFATTYPGNAAFTFNVESKRLGIGTSEPQFALDISSQTGIRIQGGGYFSGPAFGLFSITTASLISTLPTTLFAPNTIPASAFQSSGFVLPGLSVPTSALYGSLSPALFSQNTIFLSSIANPSAIVNLLQNNTVQLSSLASTGSIVLQNSDSRIVANSLSVSTLTSRIIIVDQLIVSSINQTGVMDYSTLVVSSFGFTKAVGTTVEASFFTGGLFTGNGSALTSLNPSALSGNIPASKFGLNTVPLNSLQQFGNIDVINGNATIGGTLTACNVVIASN